MKKIITLLSFAVCLNINAQIITTVAGNGISGYSGDGGQAIAAEINISYGVTLDAVGNIYIADTYNSRIRMVNTSGIITTVAGGGTGGLGDGGQATAAKLSSPEQVAFDASGNFLRLYPQFT